MTQKWIRIIVPICIVLIVAGIWMIKNSNKEIEIPTDPIEKTEETNPAIALEEEDFKLEASSVDLEVLTAYGLPVIIDFGADTCEPCKDMAPVLITLNTEMQGKAIIKFIDVRKNPAAANDFPIQVIPTQVLINADGTPYVPSDAMELKFDMYSYNDSGEHAFTVHQGGLTEEEMRAVLIDMGVSE